MTFKTRIKELRARYDLTQEDLGRLFSGARLSRNRRIVVYDGAGVGAAKVAFALALLGYPDVAVYAADGSPEARLAGCPGTPTAFAWAGSRLLAATDQGRLCARRAPDP